MPFRTGQTGFRVFFSLEFGLKIYPPGVTLLKLNPLTQYNTIVQD